MRRRVQLFQQENGLLLDEMWSHPTTGEYQFHNLLPGKYFVIAFDHTGQFSGVCETDIVLPAPPTP